jgi:hypothetical protein
MLWAQKCGGVTAHQIYTYSSYLPYTAVGLEQAFSSSEVRPFQ